MTSIFVLTEMALGTINPPIAFSLAPYSGNPLPDQYVAHQLLPSSALAHADNKEIARGYVVQVTIWSRTGLAVLPDVDAAMNAAGFKKGDVKQLPQDEKTGHFGLATEYSYLEVSFS